MQVWEEVRLHAQAGLNMLRCWGGAGCQRNALYEVPASLRSHAYTSCLRAHSLVLHYCLRLLYYKVQIVTPLVCAGVRRLGGLLV